MKIWVDADACPSIIKQILIKAATRKNISLTFVANHIMLIEKSKSIAFVKVKSGFDSADNYIVENLVKNDLVITGDILLADRVVENGAYALNPNGILYNQKNIKQTVAIRNLNESLRSAGLIKSGSNILTKPNIQAFANKLDQWLQKQRIS